MRIEPKQAFYNEDTGAVQPWKDIEVTDTVGNALVAEGLVTEIEGGGGSSDFSTAEVAIVNNGSLQFERSLSNIVTIPGSGDFLDTQISVSSGSSATIICALYKGVSILSTSGNTVAIDGNAELGNEYVIIKGDCTITLTDAT